MLSHTLVAIPMKPFFEGSHPRSLPWISTQERAAEWRIIICLAAATAAGNPRKKRDQLGDFKLGGKHGETPHEFVISNVCMNKYALNQ